MKPFTLTTPALLTVRTCVRERYITQYQRQADDPDFWPAFLLDDTLTLASEISCTIDDVIEWHETASRT